MQTKQLVAVSIMNLFIIRCVLHIFIKGSVYYYTLTGSYWSHQSKLLARDGTLGDVFGRSASIYDNNAFIGADGSDDKATDAGNYVCMYIKVLIIVSYIKGSVYYYTLTGSYWSYQSKIFAKDGVAYDYFGISVSMYNNEAYIGASDDEDKGTDAGMYNICNCYMIC